MFDKLFKKKPAEPRPIRSFGEEWLEALETAFGSVTVIKEMQVPDKPKIHLLYFDALPEEGFLTAVTCGLSSARHPDWKHSFPEMIVTMESSSHSWGLAAGYFASAFYGEKRFSYGDIFKLDEPISGDSEMSAYLVFAPSFLDQGQATFRLSDRTVVLSGMYPVYADEIPVYDRLGLKDFWHADGFEMYNPRRKHVSG